MAVGPKKKAATAIFAAALGTFSGLGAVGRGETEYGILVLVSAGLGWILSVMLSIDAWESRIATRNDGD